MAARVVRHCRRPVSHRWSIALAHATEQLVLILMPYVRGPVVRPIPLLRTSLVTQNSNMSFIPGVADAALRGPDCSKVRGDVCNVRQVHMAAVFPYLLKRARETPSLLGLEPHPLLHVMAVLPREWDKCRVVLPINAHDVACAEVYLHQLTSALSDTRHHERQSKLIGPKHRHACYLTGAADRVLAAVRYWMPH